MKQQLKIIFVGFAIAVAFGFVMLSIAHAQTANEKATCKPGVRRTAHTCDDNNLSNGNR